MRSPLLRSTFTAAALSTALVATGAASAPKAPPPDGHPTLSPNLSRMTTCEAATFHASWSGPQPVGAVSYAWSATGGTIDAQGRFRAASTPQAGSVTASAMTVGDRPLGLSASDSFTIADAFPSPAASPLTIEPMASPSPQRTIATADVFQHEAAARGGRGYFGWIEARANNQGLLAVRARDRSGAWEAPTLVPVGGGGSTLSPYLLSGLALAVDAWDENVVYLTYRTHDNPITQWFTTSRDGGKTFAPPTRIGAGLGTADIVSPKAGMVAMTAPAAGPTSGLISYYVGDPAHFHPIPIKVTTAGRRLLYTHGTLQAPPRIITSTAPDASGDVRTCILFQGMPDGGPKTGWGTYSMCTSTGAFADQVEVTPVHLGTAQVQDSLPMGAFGPRQGGVEPIVVTFLAGRDLMMGLSVDGGQTWTTQLVQSNANEGASDVRFDEDGVLWVAYNHADAVYVTKSCDFVNGATSGTAIHWSAPLQVASYGLWPALMTYDHGVSVVAQTRLPSGRSFDAWTLTP